MTTISTQQDVVTLINVFTVAPEDQQPLVEATESAMNRLPGFVSANPHMSLDGTKVTNYAQWRSREDFEAILQNPEAMMHMREAGPIAEKFEPHLYEVSFVDEVDRRHERHCDIVRGGSRASFRCNGVRDARAVHPSMKCGIPVVSGSIRGKRWCS